MAASTSLLPGPDPSYRFLPGGEPYSSGAVATPGWEVIHATLQAPVPWRRLHGDRAPSPGARPARTALCAIELRIPTPLTFAGFAEFNRGYRALLGEWGLLVDGRNPVARTNVAPVVGPPAEPSLYAFSYTVAAEEAGGPTFVAAGSGELRPGPASRASVVRPDETSADALREKAAHVMGVMQARLTGLGATWADVTAVGVSPCIRWRASSRRRCSRRWARQVSTASTGTCLTRRSRGWSTRWIFAVSGARCASRLPAHRPRAAGAIQT